MIPTGLFTMLLMVSASGAWDAEAVEEEFMPWREGYRTVFFAVIEGAYRDGLSDAHLSIILRKEEPKEYEYFVYACPLCSPTVAALELYRSRPRRLYSLKSAGSTFGSGVLPEIALMLDSSRDDQRLMGIRLLTQRWINAYLESKNLESAELNRWRKLLEAAKELGGRKLIHYRESGSAGLLAPAMREAGNCAVCEGLFQGALSSSSMGYAFPLNPGAASPRKLLSPPAPDQETGDPAP